MSDAEDEEPEGSGCGGWLVLAAAGAGTGGAVYAYSRDLLVILVWVIGAVLLWRANKKMPSAANPAPPAPPERGSDEEPQVSVVRDQDHPNRWLVTRSSEWLKWEPQDDKDES